MINRIRTGKDFTIVNNDYLRNPELSWKAKGLLTYIMSLPDDWVITVAELSTKGKDGRESTASAMRELIDQGYCRRSRSMSDNGQWNGWDYDISDMPIIDDDDAETPTTENTDSLNPKLLNTINRKTIKENRAQCEKTAPEPLKLFDTDVSDPPGWDDNFRQAWNEWKAYKKAQFRFTFKHQKAETAAKKKLIELAGGDGIKGIEIVNECMVRGYMGLYVPHGQQASQPAVRKVVI